MGFDVYHQYSSEKRIHFIGQYTFFWVYWIHLDVENLKECIWSFSYLVEYNKNKIAVAEVKVTIISHEKGGQRCAAQAGCMLPPRRRSSDTRDVHLSGHLMVCDGWWRWRRESGRTVHPFFFKSLFRSAVQHSLARSPWHMVTLHCTGVFELGRSVPTPRRGLSLRRKGKGLLGQ